MKPVPRNTLLAALLTASAFATAWSVGCTTTQPPRQQVQDSRITTQVKAKMAADVNLSTITNVNVDSTNGVVTLSGEVENERVKNRAEEIARSVEGVVKVNNNLQGE